MIGILWKCKDLPLSAKLTIYHSLVASHLNYGILIWGSELAKNLSGNYLLDHIPKNLSPLNVAHNKIIRAINGSCKYNKETGIVTHTAPILKKLNILNLNSIYYLHLSLFAYDCVITKDLPLLFTDYLKNTSNIYNSRACDHDIVIKPTELENTCRSIRIASARMWNLIPIEIRKINYSRNVFKSKVKDWLISKYIY